MVKRKGVVVGVACPTLPSPPSWSTPRRRRPHPRPQAPPQSASSHPCVNNVHAPLHPDCAPPPPPCLIPPSPPPLAQITTQSGAVPIRRGAYQHGCSVQLPMSTQVPNTSEASPTPFEGLRAFQFGIPPPCTSSFLANCCIPPCQPSSLQPSAAMLPPIPQIKLIFWGSLNFMRFRHGSSNVLHPPIAQVPTDQLPAPHTFDHAPSHLPRQCSVQKGVTRDSSVVGVGTKNKKKKSSKFPIQRSLLRVTRAATKL